MQIQQASHLYIIVLPYNLMLKIVNLKDLLATTSMNIVLATTPIRPEPTDYPPFGSMAVINSLRDIGEDPYFYDVDCLRPSTEEVHQFLLDRKPDLFLISAVVSTAYKVVKRMSDEPKSISEESMLPLRLGR